MSGGGVAAAGAVIARKGGEVLLIHRPKYDDWSFPKGKQDPGEHLCATAVREVLEETGLQIRLARPLISQVYRVGGGRTKTVNYWVGHTLGGSKVSDFVPNKEVDQLRWLPIPEARKLLTYTDDQHVLDDFAAAPKKTSTTLVVRHGRAVKRASWEGDDRRRPLTRVGREQARLLIPVIGAYAPQRVITSTSKRCADTIKPYAEALSLAVEQLPSLSEEQFTRKSLRRLADDVLSDNTPTMICSHRPVLPDLLSAFHHTEEPLSPGELVALHHRKGRLVASERHLPR